jgi:hypothetical protein
MCEASPDVCDLDHTHSKGRLMSSWGSMATLTVVTSPFHSLILPRVSVQTLITRISQSGKFAVDALPNFVSNPLASSVS